MSDPTSDGVPDRLLARLDRLGEVLEQRGDALALIALGSVGRDTHRLDDHSDLDFFVVVDDDAKQAYLDRIDWLEALAPVAFSFRNSRDGRKALFGDGLFAEYAVFTLAELRAAAYQPGRVVWRRPDAPDDLAVPALPAAPAPTTPEFQVGEALTCLYVGLHRELRGERLSATRFIQGYAVDRLVTLLGLLRCSPQQDPYAVERGVERRLGQDLLPLAELVPGYESNAESALAVLGLLERNAPVDRTMAAAVRDLAQRARATRPSSQTGPSVSRT